MFINEHLQSYFYFVQEKSSSIRNFQIFGNLLKIIQMCQKVIDNYSPWHEKIYFDAGFQYQAILNTLPPKEDFFHSNFTIHYPHILLEYKVPFY